MSSLLQNYENQNEFIKFASLFLASIVLVSTYCWFGQQVIDEVSFIGYEDRSLPSVHKA
jgi:hypothetical protein